MVPATHLDAAGTDPGDPDGARRSCGRRSWARSPTSMSRRSAASNSCSASSCPISGVAMLNFAPAAAMAVLVFGVPLKGSLAALIVARTALCHGDDRLRAADLRLRPHADRRPVRHRDPDGAAGDAVLRHDGAGFHAVRFPADDGPVFPMTYFLPISVGTSRSRSGLPISARRWRASRSSFRC